MASLYWIGALVPEKAQRWLQSQTNLCKGFFLMVMISNKFRWWESIILNGRRSRETKTWFISTHYREVYQCHCVLTCQHFGSLFKDLFKITKSITSKLRITGLLWGGSIGDWGLPLKGSSAAQKRFHVMTSYGLGIRISAEDNSLDIFGQLSLHSLSGKTYYRQISWSLEAANGCYNDRIALMFNRYIGSVAAEGPVKFLSDWKSLNPNLAAMRLHEILW